MDTKPHELSLSEWREIIKMPVVRESWGLEENATPEEFAAMVYAARFDFCSGGPGYFGDLFVLQGDMLTGDAPLMLTRANDGSLQVA